MAASLVVHLVGKAGGLLRTLTQGASAVNSFGSKVAGLASPFGKLLGPVAALTAGISAIGLASWGVQLAAQAETAQAQFTTLLKSEEKANQLLGQITQFAAATPFQDADLKGSARQLLAAGTAVDQVIPSLKVLGDISAGSGKNLTELTAIFAKIKGAGKLTGETLNQLAEAGIPIRTQLAASMGVAESEITGLVSASKVGFGTVQQALLDMTSGSGLFAGGMEKQSQTIEGLWSTLKDNVALVFRDIGGVILEEFDFKGLVSNATEFAQTFRSEWLPSIRSTIHAVAETFQGTVILLQDAWNGWLGDAVETLTWGVGNFDLLWQIAWQQVVLFATNSWERIKTFFVNIGELGVWFSNNWVELFADIAAYTGTVVSNMGKNLHAFFVAVSDWLSGKGFNFEWTGLTEGFESRLKELPQLTQAALRETTPELERLYNELNRRDQANLTQAVTDGITAANTEIADFEISENLTSSAGKKSAQKDNVAGLALEGTQAAFEAITKAMRQGGEDPQKKALRLQEQQLKQDQEQVRLLRDIAQRDGNQLVAAEF